MNVICPEHGGVIHISGKALTNRPNVSIINLVVECPVCEDEVLVSGVFNFDKEGNPYKVGEK
ncbi:hypothetical protein [Pedobacter sp. SYSU D00535]|uniref:hypothetical protein n=1 Tax=Pedobacter sp. SYSU D00535 TaxID=2810308 RepID=UPI001A978920|nr:hypothetical protein [Pedobacter sp. SYSU D00535]